MARRRGKKQDTATAPVTSTVLVVHDDPDGCELLVRILSAVGHQVSRAADFLSMSDQLQDPPVPGCIVLDVATGGIGGNLKLLDAIRNHRNPDVAGTRVVLVATSDASAMFSWQAGIDGFLLRPFHADDLITTVGEALALSEDDRRHHRRRMLDAAKANNAR